MRTGDLALRRLYNTALVRRTAESCLSKHASITTLLHPLTNLHPPPLARQTAPPALFVWSLHTTVELIGRQRLLTVLHVVHLSFRCEKELVVDEASRRWIQAGDSIFAQLNDEVVDCSAIIPARIPVTNSPVIAAHDERKARVMPSHRVWNDERGLHVLAAFSTWKSGAERNSHSPSPAYHYPLKA